MTFSQIESIDKENIMPTYARYKTSLEKGEGATAYDTEGKKYIDFGSGIGVNSLGYSDRGWVEAVNGQLNKIQHISNYYYNSATAELAEKLCTATGYDKAFLCNSGAEANECAIKLARKYSFDKYGKGRSEIITLINSFHGRTITTLTATGQEQFHNFFFPFARDFSYAKANDIENVKALVNDKTCAIMIEVIQGEGGVIPLDKDFVKELYSLCSEKDILLICDEVQTGIGRTGRLLAGDHYNITPHIVTLAKGLAGGLPIGACLCTKELSGVLSAGHHGSTFGGNPVSCAGASYVLSKVATPDFLNEVTKKGEYIKERLKSMPDTANVRGLGLMIGFDLKKSTSKDVAGKCLEGGLLILTAKSAVRLLPPLNITYGEIDAGLEILEKVLSEAEV